MSARRITPLMNKIGALVMGVAVGALGSGLLGLFLLLIVLHSPSFFLHRIKPVLFILLHCSIGPCSLLAGFVAGTRWYAANDRTKTAVYIGTLVGVFYAAGLVGVLAPYSLVAPKMLIVDAALALATGPVLYWWCREVAE
ncbi:MAG: hypothetical protein NT018_04415 [Armatimonadetes bacterium]|nr:hypothetical protein [Armatimonadota bacterium]